MTHRAAFVVVAAVITIGIAPAGTSTMQGQSGSAFEEAELFFELNDTDDDLGFHASIDGGPWASLTIEGPGDIRLLDIISRGALRRQSMTQLDFESAEPGLDEQPPAVIFRRFPEGTYEVEGVTLSGEHLESTTVVSHVLPAAPDNITLTGVPAAEDCDVNPLPTVNKPVVIDWDPVTTSHPEIGKKGRVTIVRYQLFVERAGRVSFAVDLPPTITRFTVPAGVTNLAKEFKFEIIARASNLNNTAVESCYRVN